MRCDALLFPKIDSRPGSMIILLTGVTGFIGSHLAAVLRAAGHCVRGTQRGPGQDASCLHADFSRDFDVALWIPRLTGVDVVINAVGILRQTPAQSFTAIHTLAPRALFRACALAGVRRVIQISALGAETGQGGYFSSKHAADEFLSELPLDWTIVQPSLVYAPGGASASLFSMLATLPVIPLPGGGGQRVQPVHMDDLTTVICKLCECATEFRRRVPVVGPHPVSLRDMLQQLRIALGLPQAPTLTVPAWMMRFAAKLSSLSPSSLLTPETLAMLEADNIADPTATTRLLGKAPRCVPRFIDPTTRITLASQARLQWLLPLLRIAVASVWIWTGIVSLGLYPVQLSLELLARTGVPAQLAPLLLYGAALLDLALGAAILLVRRRGWLWLFQIALILSYTAIITLRLPEFWLHPYGPMIKNVPLIMVIYVLYVLEQRTWTT